MKRCGESESVASLCLFVSGFAFSVICLYSDPAKHRVEFFQWSTFEPQKAFIGFNNYIELFHDPVFYQSLKNNALYAAVSIVFQVGGGLITAAILEDRLLRKSSPFSERFFPSCRHFDDGYRFIIRFYL